MPPPAFFYGVLTGLVLGLILAAVLVSLGSTLADRPPEHG